MADPVLTDSQVIDLTNTLGKSIEKSIKEGFQSINLPNSKAPGGSNRNNLPKNQGLNFSNLLEASSTAFGSLANVINKNSLNIAEFGGMVSDSADFLAKINPAYKTLNNIIKMSGKGVELFAGFIQENVTVFRALSKVGASFNGDLLELQKNSAIAGMSLEDFARFTIQNSTQIAALGKNTTDGAKAFANFSKELQTNEVFDQLAKLGMSFEEMTEFTLRNMASTRRQAMIQAGVNATELQVNTEQTKIVRRLAKNLSIVSDFTGKQADEIEADMRARSRESSSRAAVELMQRRGAENAVENFELLNTALDNAPQQLQDLFKDIIARRVASPDTAAFAGVNTEATALAMQARRMLQQGASAEDLLEVANQAIGKTIEFANSDRGLFLTTLKGMSDTADAQASVFDDTLNNVLKLQNTTGRLRITADDFINQIDQLAERVEDRISDAPDDARGALVLATEFEQATRRLLSEARIGVITALEEVGIEGVLDSVGQAIEVLSAKGIEVNTDQIPDIQNLINQDNPKVSDAAREMIEELFDIKNTKRKMNVKELDTISKMQDYIRSQGLMTQQYQDLEDPSKFEIRQQEFLNSLTDLQKDVIAKAQENNPDFDIFKHNRLAAQGGNDETGMGGVYYDQNMTAEDARRELFSVFDNFTSQIKKFSDSVNEITFKPLYNSFEEEFLKPSDKELQSLRELQKENSSFFFELFDDIKDFMQEKLQPSTGQNIQSSDDVKTVSLNEKQVSTMRQNIQSRDNVGLQELFTKIEDLINVIANKTEDTSSATAVNSENSMNQIQTAEVNADIKSFESNKTDEVINILNTLVNTQRDHLRIVKRDRNMIA